MSGTPEGNPFGPRLAASAPSANSGAPPSMTPGSGAAMDVREVEASRLTRAEQWLARMGERLNPILVKEARQALKSNQFLITFTLLMMCGWAWSFFGVILRMPEIRYTASGAYMLAGYFIILTVPLFVIVPFAAFRSLAAEREDGTFELMSITTLSARQIVTGKLGSAVLQMLVYFSALSPCIGFTYLLRGIDVPVIVIILTYTLGISILLSAFGLLVATVSRHRHWQVFLSVGLILGLVLATWLWCLFVFETMLMGYGFAMVIDDPVFWAVQAMLITVIASFTILFIQASASRITFASDNRSTQVRVTIFAQLVLFLGWCFYFAARDFDSELIIILMLLPSLYLSVIGAMMIGESGVLSPRVRRQLPQSFLGRMAFTWFNPGSATGYFFIVSNLLGILIITLGVYGFGVIAGKMGVGLGRNDGRYFWFGFLCWCYVTTYLGAARVLTSLARRYHIGSLALSFLLTTFIAVSAAAFPLLVQGLMVGFTRIDYSVLQATNWIWTLNHCLEKGMTGVPEVLWVTGALAVFMIIVNLFLARREIGQVRVAQ